MPTPATTGLLRTKVSEMEIGDYIKMHHQSIAGQSPFLLTTGPSIPESEIAGNVLGTAARNKYWYMIKVAKGLLVADRVFAHTYSWDSFNSLKWIQGLPWDGGNIIPTMTSNTSPSGVASSSNESDKAHTLFDRSMSTGWSVHIGSQPLPGWIQYEFPNPMAIRKYSLSPRGTYTTRTPRVWTFEAWDEANSKWDILDTQSNFTAWQSNTKMYFSLSNTKPYKKYRVNISANNGDSMYLEIGELEMFETAGTIRSLTGGVAYADANGNKVTADAGFGGWPTNNEWDRYIVNFPQDKIQPGKTLDDVFHWSVTYTLAQDTPSTSLNTNRATRGYNSLSRFGWDASSNTNAKVGFRPVFAYKE